MLVGSAQAFAAHSITPIIPNLSNFVGISAGDTRTVRGEQLSWIFVPNWWLILPAILFTDGGSQNRDSGFLAVCMCFIFWFERFTKGSTGNGRRSSQEFVSNFSGDVAEMATGRWLQLKSAFSRRGTKYDL